MRGAVRLAAVKKKMQGFWIFRMYRKAASVYKTAAGNHHFGGEYGIGTGSDEPVRGRSSLADLPAADDVAQQGEFRRIIWNIHGRHFSIIRKTEWGVWYVSGSIWAPGR